MGRMEQVPQQQPQDRVPPPDMVRIRNLVQIALAQAAYPMLDARAALKQWIGDGLSTLFSDYFEDVSHSHELAGVDASNPAALQELLKKIENYQQGPESLH